MQALITYLQKNLNHKVFLKEKKKKKTFSTMGQFVLLLFKCTILHFIVHRTKFSTKFSMENLLSTPYMIIHKTTYECCLHKSHNYLKMSRD